MGTTQPQPLSVSVSEWFRAFTQLGKAPRRDFSATAQSAAVEAEVKLDTPQRPKIAPRGKADAELAALLAEIPTWPDSMLVHMHKRFATSRLFRRRHDPRGPLTDRALVLRHAALAEIQRRGLQAMPVED